MDIDKDDIPRNVSHNRISVLCQEVVMSEQICLLVELSIYGTVYQTLSVLLASLFLRDVLELLILVSF